MCSVVTVVLVIQLVGEAGLFELAVLSAGAVLVVGSDKHRVLYLVTIGNACSIRGLLCLGAHLRTFGIPTRDIAPAALVTMATRTPAALAVFAYGCLQGVGARRSVSAVALSSLGGGCDLTLALRVDTKLGTL